LHPHPPADQSPRNEATEGNDVAALAPVKAIK